MAAPENVSPCGTAAVRAPRLSSCYLRRWRWTNARFNFLVSGVGVARSGGRVGC